MNAPLSRREALRITAVAGLGLALGGGLTRELLRAAGLRRVRSTRVALGTRVTLTAIHPDSDAARLMVDTAFHEIERLEGILSRHRAETPLSRLNRTGVLETPPAELVEVLERALQVASLTEGAFDPTVAPLLELHAKRFTATGGPPSAAEVATTLSRVGYRSLQVQPHRIAFQRPDMGVTLDGIAKGFVVDRTVERLRRFGAEHVLVEAGGDLAATGTPAGADGWEVAVQDPRDAQGRLELLRISGKGVATSGDYVQAFSRDRRHHPILDPRTGWSPEEVSAATVVAPSAMDADALSTAAMVLGPQDTAALLDTMEGVEALLVTKEGITLRTDRFTAPEGRRVTPA